MAAPRKLAEKLIPWAAGLSLALPVLVAHYPPMSDLPLHEAVVGVLRHLKDPVFNPGLYELHLGHPNQLFVLVAFALSWLVSVPMAIKLTVALSVLAICLSAGRFAAHMKTSPWVTLLVAPLGVGWMFFWGLIANMVGLAALLFTLPALDRYVKEPSARALPKALGLCVLLFFAHESMLLAACGFLLLVAVLAPWEARKTALRAAPALISLVLAFAEVKLLGTNTISDIPTVWGSELHRVLIIPGLVSAGFEMWVRHTIFGLAVLSAALFVSGRVKAAREQREPSTLPWRERLLHNRFELLTLALLVAYFTFPMTLHGATLVYHRFLPPAWAIGVIALARPVPGSDGPHRLAPACALVTVLAAFTVALPVFADAHTVWGDLDTVIAPMKPGQSVMLVELGPTPPHRLFSPTTAEGHAVALKGGRSFFDFTLSHISAAYMKPEYHLPHTYKRLWESNFLFRPEVDLKRFRYVIVHTRDPMRAAAAVTAMNPEAHLVTRRGEWLLFESNLEVVPLTAPDEPLTDQRATTLHLRVIESLKLLRGRDVEELLNGPPVPVP
jgi:hypothetical protein